jgi:protocatechuate 3,4-dioxygenase beta subunit
VAGWGKEMDEPVASSAPSVITCRIRDAEGNPVAGARVFFASGPGPYPDMAALTNDAGEAILAAPAPGTYEIQVAADGFAPQTETVTAAAGEAIARDIIVERA